MNNLSENKNDEGTHLRTLCDPASDKQNNTERVDHPHYYNNGPYILFETSEGIIKIPIECIDVIRDMPTWKGNVIKYLWREGDKTEQGMSDKEKELEDLRKAKWYLDDKIKHMTEELNMNS